MPKMTIKEIAQLAGISASAVSIVLNNRPGFSENNYPTEQLCAESQLPQAPL